MRHSKKLAALAIAAGVAITASAAFAYWTTTGSGSGSASVGTTSDLSISPVTITGTLVPGGTAAAVAFTINNGSPTVLHLGQVVADEGVVTNDVPAWPHGISGLPNGCSPLDFTFSSAATSYSVPATGTAPGSGTLSMSDSANNQDACKGTTPVLHVKALQGS